MSEEPHNHDHDVPDHSSFVHRARHSAAPAAAIASALTVLHERGIAFAVGAVVAWLLTFLFYGMAADHDWRVCPLCARPPRSMSTADRRVRLARRQHSRPRKKLWKLTIVALLAHAFLPKPYMDPWWGKMIIAGVYLAVAVMFGRNLIATGRHKRHREDCPVEWCRAGLEDAPGLTWRKRRHMWTGHHGVWLLALLAPVVCTVGIYCMHYPSIVLKAAYGLLTYMLISVVVSMFGQHYGDLCLHCRPPSHGSQTAEARMRWLKLYHQAGVGILCGAFTAWAASWMTAGTEAAKILICAAALSVVFWAVLERIHSPVKPWCPWCKDDGGEDADADVPDPTTNVPSPA